MYHLRHSKINIDEKWDAETKTWQYITRYAEDQVVFFPTWKQGSGHDAHAKIPINHFSRNPTMFDITHAYFIPIIRSANGRSFIEHFRSKRKVRVDFKPDMIEETLSDLETNLIQLVNEQIIFMGIQLNQDICWTASKGSGSIATRVDPDIILEFQNEEYANNIGRENQGQYLFTTKSSELQNGSFLQSCAGFKPRFIHTSPKISQTKDEKTIKSA
jgi:hypothetical protein